MYYRVTKINVNPGKINEVVNYKIDSIGSKIFERYS